MTVDSVAPGIFTANSDGRGVPTALAVRVAADDTQTIASVFRLDSASGRFVAAPSDPGRLSSRGDFFGKLNLLNPLEFLCQVQNNRL